MRRFFLSLLLLVMSTAFTAARDHINIRGLVVDEESRPVYGALVTNDGRTVKSNARGKFSIEAAEGSDVVISCDGYRTLYVYAEKEIRAVLRKEIVLEKEIVKVGYGEQEKGAVIGSVSQITDSDMESMSSYAPIDAMEGKASGLSITKSGNGEDFNMVVRGFSSWNGNDPLVIVDGVERSMDSLTTPEIESISVLKDASATAVYGAKGANGVILITTKTGKGLPSGTTLGESSVTSVPGPLSFLQKDEITPEGWFSAVSSADTLGLAPDAFPVIADKIEKNCFNVKDGWNAYREGQILKTADNSAVFLFYAPCTARFRVGEGTILKISESGQYPFRDNVTITVNVSYPARFPLYFRIPSWCMKPSVRVDGVKVSAHVQGGQFLCLDREWASEVKIVLNFPMDLSGTGYGPFELCNPDGSEPSSAAGKVKVKHLKWQDDVDPFSFGKVPLSFSKGDVLLVPKCSTIK